MIPGFDETAALLGRTLYFFVLLFLPAFAAAAAVLKRGCRSLVLASLVALAATGLNGYVVFWVCFAGARTGRAVALLVPIFSLVSLALIVPWLDVSGRRILRAISLPLLLCGVFSVFVLSAGFVYGGLNRPFETAQVRFSHHLPVDNAVPYIFAEGIRDEHISKPLFADWNSSDRPPLQSGLDLAVYRYYSQDRQLSAQIVGVLAQSTFILALWIFLTALGLDSGVVAWILAACVTSGFVLVNTFFVWPKLLAAAYTLGAFTVLLNVSGKWAPVWGGLLIALGMLAHGGSIFALLGAAVTCCILRVRIPPRSLAVLLGSALLFYLPWLSYQKFYDPPGDRLIKMHLADIQRVDPRPLGQALVEAYEAKTAKQIFENKWANWTMAMANNSEYWLNIWQMLHADQLKAAENLRTIQFFTLGPTIGFLGLGIPALLFGAFKRFRTQYWRIAMRLFLFILVTVLIWCALMFGPAMTVLHQGTYVTVLLAFAACCLSLYSLSPNLVRVLVALQAVTTFVLYGPLMRMHAPEHPNPSLGYIRVAALVTAFAAALVTIWLLYCIAEVDSGVARGQKTVHLFAFKS